MTIDTLQPTVAENATENLPEHVVTPVAPPAPVAETAAPDPWANVNWKPRFFSIWGGQALSLIGSALTNFVLVWWITETTGSAGALATSGIAAMLPQAIFGPLGGTLADRWSRRMIMIAADTITALCMITIIFLFATGNIQLWHVYTLMFVRSTMQAFQAPASAASTSMLVPPDWLPRAAGMNQTVAGLMGVAAAPLGAAALGILPLQGALMIDVVTALLGILPLLLFKIPQPPRTDTLQMSVWEDFRQGVRLVTRNRGLLMLYAVVTIMVMVLMPAFVLTPLLVLNDFNGGVNHVAVMEGLSGVGMIVGGILVSVLTLPKRRVPVVLWAFAVSCTAIALTGLTPGNLFWLAVVWWMVSGVTFAFGNAPVMAIIQTVVPNELQGRALSLFSTMIGLAGPIGLLLAAPLGEIIGVRGMLVAGGSLAALTALAGFLSPALRRVDDEQVTS